MALAATVYEPVLRSRPKTELKPLSESNRLQHDFAGVYREFYDDICGYLISLTRNKAVAEDLTQETFVKALKYDQGFEESSPHSLKRWLYTIARNNFRDHYRAEIFVQRTIEQYPLLEDSTPAPVDFQSDYERLMAGLGTILLPEFRETFYHLLQGKEYHEIAEELQIPIGTVMSRLFRARQFLKARLASADSLEERLQLLTS